MPPRRRNRARRRPITPSARAVETGADAAAGELRLDIHEMFSHYNTLYFDDSLSCCAVSWSSSTRYIGYCEYYSGGCEICLSEPFLSTQSMCDLKNALLHEMIHAFLWIKYNNGDHSDHGSSFQATMNSISSSSVMDPQRPAAGYSIMFDHDLQEHQDVKARQMNCELGRNVITSNRNRTLVSDSSKNLLPNQSLDSSFISWYWNSHKELHSGISISPEPPESNYEKINSNAEEKCAKTEDMKKRLPSRVGARRQKLHDKGQKATHTEEKNSLKKYFKSSGEVAHASLDTSFDRGESQVQSKFGELENVESQMGAKKVPKRRRTSNYRKHVSTPSKRRKQGTSGNGCTVMIPSLGYYEIEGDDDAEPLLNKRSERRKKEKLLDSLLHRSAQAAATDGKSLALIGASGNGGGQDVDSSVIYTEGCHSMTPYELVKDAHEARPCLFQIENIEIDTEPSMKDVLLLCPADDQIVESGAFEDESSVRVQNCLRKSMTPPNSLDLVYISDD
ncbi:uncharacterized protein LOC122009167 [Zingiber officinale]|uniref:uncharacterized protein LOC122009167 n=1 Tax=Zingiber officinale TaxID=94328 RepID=UPI001C4CDF45|nr:uncharacterized protein LOC122009167 [Zingiber officinale]XP_042421128.1 uncharacterized protein LOC122009167 [Zingiber officinale]